MTESSPDGTDLLARVLDVVRVRGGTRLRLMRKHGRVLCALPEERELALRTLGLYSPQRPLARLAAAAVRAGLRTGWIGRVLPEILVVEGGADGLASCGVLLGSAGHAIERAVAVLPVPGGTEVAKVAFGERGRKVLETEAGILEQIQGDRSGAPELRGIEHRDEATVLRMPWDEGRPLRSSGLGPAVGVLDRWLRGDERRPLGEFEEWSLAEAQLGQAGVAASRRERMAERPVAVSLRHGDFARWNLRVRGDGEIRVHDWERGRLEGPAGFDLVHFLVQEALLVRRRPPQALVREVAALLRREPVAGHLRKAGWEGAETDLLLAVLAFTTAAGYEDQSALVRAMISDP